MPITTDVDNDNQLTIFTLTGDVSIGEIMTAINQFYEGPQTMDALWDARNGRTTFSFNEAEEMMNYPDDRFRKRPNGKSAVVVSRDIEYGLSRMITTLAEFKELSFQIIIIFNLKI